MLIGKVLQLVPEQSVGSWYCKLSAKSEACDLFMKKGLKGRIPVNLKGISRRKCECKGREVAKQGRPKGKKKKRNERNLAKAIREGRKKWLWTR